MKNHFFFLFFFFYFIVFIILIFFTFFFYFILLFVHNNCTRRPAPLDCDHFYARVTHHSSATEDTRKIYIIQMYGGVTENGTERIHGVFYTLPVVLLCRVRCPF
uniref:Uncharacterized protein n=1 Tax=Sipha flava TaxID=143950 RepID=A0A2S2QFY0_9HEMI